jgi:hypothetical protein
MDSEPFTTELDPARHVATVWLARPTHGNRLTTNEIAALGRTIRELEAVRM